MKGDKDDRCILVVRQAAQSFAQPNAAHARHINVQQHQIKVLPFQQVERGAGIRSADRLILRSLERNLIGHVAHAVIVHQEHPRLGRTLRQFKRSGREKTVQTVHRLNQSLN